MWCSKGHLYMLVFNGCPEITGVQVKCYPPLQLYPSHACVAAGSLMGEAAEDGKLSFALFHGGSTLLKPLSKSARAWHCGTVGYMVTDIRFPVTVLAVPYPCHLPTNVPGKTAEGDPSA